MCSVIKKYICIRVSYSKSGSTDLALRLRNKTLKAYVNNIDGDGAMDKGCEPTDTKLIAMVT